MSKSWPNLTIVVLLVGAMSAPRDTGAQYTVHEWTHFESGAIPETAVTIGPNVPKNLRIVNLNEVQGVPGEFRSGEAAHETGRYGMLLHHDGDMISTRTCMSGLIVGDVLDRDSLGQSGRALFQADFFIPADGWRPDLAVLAMEPPNSDGTRPKNVDQAKGAFYRFGMRRLDKSTYFSLIRRNKPAKVYPDKEIMQVVPRPGWHRFAIVFEGPETIRCFIDGRETGFSPIREKTIRKLVVGVVLIDIIKQPYDAYVDNLSIQVSQDAASLPASPYTAGWTIPPGLAKERTPGANPNAAQWQTPSPLSADKRWLLPEEAWSQAQRDKKPMLLYFYAPGAEATPTVDDWVLHDNQARKFLDQHACGSVDVNQLQGGTLAKRYEVFKVPTILVISPDAQRYAKAVYARGEKWTDLEAKLKLAP